MWLPEEMLPEHEDGFETGGSIPQIAGSLLGAQVSVSVVIPCYRQGRFLGEAIASAAEHDSSCRRSSVDDGSADDTPAVATRDVSVRYLRQEPKGLSEARYSGWRVEPERHRLATELGFMPPTPPTGARSRGVRLRTRSPGVPTEA